MRELPMREFTCAECGVEVACAIAGVLGDDPVRELCFLCLWLREEAPDDAAKRARLRAEISRE